MSPFDRAHMTSYWRSIVTMALSRVVSEIFMSKNIAIWKSQSRVNQVHWMWYHLIDWILLVFYSNFVHKTHHFWDIRLQICRDLENRIRGPRRSLKMSPFDRAHTPSVKALQLLLEVCEQEFDSLDMFINAQKSYCIRIGPRFNIDCHPLGSGHKR